jgi:hypothetical protein
MYIVGSHIEEDNSYNRQGEIDRSYTALNGADTWKKYETFYYFLV